MHRLINIQQNLKAPKNQRNNFGGYSYRSCEDILEAVKPLLIDTKTILIIKDEIIQIGDRYYIKAIATLYGDDGKEIASTSAFAREEENKKGMDASQLTGATSSYARKYALNGLFAIDDTKDADATNKHGKEKENPPVKGKLTTEKTEPVNDDFDLLEELRNKKDIPNLVKFFNENQKAAKDKAAFMKEFRTVKATLEKGA